MRSFEWRASSTLLGLLGILGLAGCSEIQPVTPADEPVTDPAQLYMRLAVDHPAVTLSTAAGYNSIQLTATPLDAAGDPMSGLSAPTFRSTDTTVIRVTPEGLVTTIGTGSGNIVTELTVGPVSHADTTEIAVTDLTNPPTLASLSIHVVPPDSTVWSQFWDDSHYRYDGLFIGSPYAYSFGRFSPSLSPARALDTEGNAIDGIPIEYTSLDPAVATISRRAPGVSLRRPGTVRIAVRTNVYGVVKVDTAAFTVTLPVVRMVALYNSVDNVPGFVPSEVKIAPYGLVFWTNFLHDPMDITWDDPTNVETPPADVCDRVNAGGFVYPAGSTCGVSGALTPGWRGGDTLPSIQVWRFPVPGVYTYHSTSAGASGRVVVSADGSTP